MGYAGEEQNVQWIVIGNVVHERDTGDYRTGIALTMRLKVTDVSV